MTGSNVTEMGAIYNIASQYLPFIRKKRRPTRQEALSTKPIRNPVVEWDKNELGEVNIYIPRRKDLVARFLCWVLRAPEKKTITVEEVGGFVWELCDGKHTVDSIVSQICSKYKMSRREAEVLVSVYLKTLADRRLIGFKIGGVRNK